MGARRITIAALVLALVAPAACSDDESDSGLDPDAESDPGGDSGDSGDSGDDVPSDSAATLTFAPDAEVTADDLARAVAVVEQRIEALDVDATVAADADEGTIEVGLADDDPAVADEVSDAVEARGQLQFRPVLATDPSGATEVTPAADVRPDAPVDLADEQDVVHSLGPTDATGEIIESAEARMGETGQWEVALVLHPGDEGIDRFNRIAATCFEAGPTCPTRQVAIVLDAVVQSAPTIQQAAFERDQIIIVGDFETEDATNLATVLESGALPFALTLQP